MASTKKTLKLIKWYLENKVHNVKLIDVEELLHKSEILTINHWAPQGSILGPV